MRTACASVAIDRRDPRHADAPEQPPLDATISEATRWLIDQQQGDGHWVFELEADATIPAAYIFLQHFLGHIDEARQEAIARYLRRTQGVHGGWPLYNGGDFDLSASVKAYFALKLVGDDPDSPHMQRARAAILARGGAARANVFTRIYLALFGQVPWRAAPWIRPEAMLMPRWAFFHIDKVSYWSRTVMVPLFVLAAIKPIALNPRRVDIRELFVIPPEQQRGYLTNPTGKPIGSVFLAIDRIGRRLERLMPKRLEELAIRKAMAFVTERLNGEDGLGGIFPAMVYARMAFDALGYRATHPDVVTCMRSIEKLVVQRAEETYVQPCLSPVWDTALALHALREAASDREDPAVDDGCRWLVDRQVLHLRGDWASSRPGLRSGGWAFQYRNDHYPDVDDTAVVIMALHRADEAAYAHAISRGREWVEGMQSRNGGWGAFDADNEHYALNSIPFADHGALLDPPSADVTARCLGMFAQLGYRHDYPAVARGVEWLKAQQEPDGSWFGRWGTNYIYGTWSVLCGLNAVGEDPDAPHIRRAADYLKSRQRPDGGWGEDCASYWPNRKHEVQASTPSQTAWALLGLMAAGEVDSPEVRRGIDYLLNAPRDGGKWQEELYNAVGFPRVFYLKYHGYSAYFPLWALARYRNLCQGNARTPAWGI